MGNIVTNEEEFYKCLEDASALCIEHFCPEIDNLEDQTIGSILNKVLTERDVFLEGHFFAPEDVAEKWLLDVNKFMIKWRDKVEIEEERAMYSKFK